MLRLRPLLVILSLLIPGLWPALSAGEPSLQPLRWMSTHHVNHPLVGTVWSGKGVPSSWAILAQQIARARFVFVGEIHTNADHHLLQARVLQLLAARGRKPNVVWEMIAQSKGNLLRRSNLRSGRDAVVLGKKLNWAAGGWPSWQIYQPIAVSAVQAGMPMFGAALEREFLYALARDGADSLRKKTLTRLHLTRPLAAEDSESMLDVLYDAHCQLMPRNALGPMQLAQRARDGAMADVMQMANARDGAVLIAGNGHVRNDWGVPAVLAQAGVAGKKLSIAQIEVNPEMADPQAYIESTAGKGIYDFVVLTPRSEIRDHCADLKKRFSKGHKN